MCYKRGRRTTSNKKRKKKSKTFFILSTVKPVHNDHPWDPKIVAVVDRWLLYGGRFMV